MVATLMHVDDKEISMSIYSRFALLPYLPVVYLVILWNLPVQYISLATGDPVKLTYTVYQQRLLHSMLMHLYRSMLCGFFSCLKIPALG